MAKTFAESVKLPNLVNVPHPSNRLLGLRTKSELNIEGRNKYDDLMFMNSHRDNEFNNADRKELISSLLGGKRLY